MACICTKHALLVCLAAITIRLLVGLQGYSGQGVPPKFGDYEAQRHWMELTLHTPLQEWYVETPNNPLHYWGIDYPPGSAYQSYLTGLVMHATEPQSVALVASRGFESERSKTAMRLTVLLSDLIILFPALAAASWGVAGMSLRAWKQQKAASQLRGTAFICTFAVAMLQPALILIDHGHFQYNGIALGLTAAAVAAVLQGWHILASGLYILSINHKHMLIYFAPAFFAYLLGCCLRQPPVQQDAQGNGKGSGHGQRWRPLPQAAAAVAALGMAVIASMLAVWGPFLAHPGLALKVLQRLVPVHRGIFEDYVANFWCSTHAFIKWKRLFPQQALVRLALGSTAAALTPSCLHQIARPSRLGFLYCLTNSAFAFYMFSYQVHEKSILMPMLPLALLYVFEPRVCALSLPLAAFSMFPLLERDGQILPYLALTACAAAMAPDVSAAWGLQQVQASVDELSASETAADAAVVAGSSQQQQSGSDGSPTVDTPPEGVSKGGSGIRAGERDQPYANVPASILGRVHGAVTGFVDGAGWWQALATSTAIAVVLHVARAVYTPPESLPYLHDLLMTAFSFGHFWLLMLYFNMRQVFVPAEA